MTLLFSLRVCAALFLVLLLKITSPFAFTKEFWVTSKKSFKEPVLSSRPISPLMFFTKKLFATTEPLEIDALIVSLL